MRLGIGFLMCCVFAAWGVIHLKWDASDEPPRLWTDVNQRDPASLPSIYTGLTEEQKVNRVLEGLSIQVSNTQFGLSIGLFSITDANPQLVRNACVDFGEVVFTFEAENYITGDRAPRLEVEVPCIPKASDPTASETIWIDNGSVKSLKGEFTASNVSLKLINFSDDGWEPPKNWRLIQVELQPRPSSGAKGEIRPLIIGKEQISESTIPHRRLTIN